MSWLPLQTVAQVSVERIINALPEGILIALFAWVLLRLLRRQNSGTRFAVWFLALLAVVALPLLGIATGVSHLPGMSSLSRLRPAVTVPRSWALFVFMVWAVGASLAMARLLTGLWRLRQLRQSFTAIDGASLDPLVRKTTDAIRASGSVVVTTSERVRVPVAVGFRKRTIVLPSWILRELPAEDLNVILLHEFAHLRRCDDWTNLFQKIVRALFFFHPAVWWIDNRLSVEREMACDDAVLAETANPRGYANCLVGLLEKSLAHRVQQQPWSMVQAAVHRAREASLRLAQILDDNRPKTTRVWKPALGMVAAFSMVCLVSQPNAPQLVAFDRGAVGNFDQEQVATIHQPSMQPATFHPSVESLASEGAVVVSAASRTTVASPRLIPASLSVRAAQGEVIPARTLGRTSAPTIAAGSSPGAPNGRLIQASANADQEAQPAFQTLVFVETTQYFVTDASVWRVQIWRVTMLSPVRNLPLEVPVANSI
jgi:beta-lactamase regulating signal transducer with metallopeptidase domain